MAIAGTTIFNCSDREEEEIIRRVYRAIRWFRRILPNEVLPEFFGPQISTEETSLLLKIVVIIRDHLFGMTNSRRPIVGDKIGWK